MLRVKAHSKIVDLRQGYELLPHNFIRFKLGYQYLGIIRCPSLNEDPDCHEYKGHKCNIYIDHIWVDNIEEYKEYRTEINQNNEDVRMIDVILTLENTIFGYHIVDMEADEDYCHYSYK